MTTCSKKSRRAAMRATAEPTPPAPTTRILTSHVDRGHHVLDARVVLEPVHREVLAGARVLEAAVGHLGDDRDVRVDPHAAEVEAPGHAHGPAVVLGEDAGREPVLHAVRPGHGLVLVGEALHAYHRAEHL